MAAGGTLLVILVLTSVNVMLAKRPNSPNHLLICENATGNFSKCENYPGIINIMNVEFKEENEDYCDNQPSRNRSKCFASERDEQKLTSILGKICDGKRKCKVHLSHGVYEGMDLPCRDLNIRIRIGIFYDCIYSPKPSGSPYKPTYSTAEPSTTEISTTSLSTLPSSTLTSATVEVSTDASRGTYAGETTTIQVSNTTNVWKRRRPRSCNLSEEIDGTSVTQLSSEGNLQFPMPCGTGSLLVYIYSLMLTLVS